MSKKITCRITFTEELLGTWPADEEIAETYIAANAPDAKTLKEEIAALGVEEVADKSRTIFPRAEDGTPILYDYQIKGFFKDSCGSLARVKSSESSKLKAYKKIIDGNIFVTPRQIRLDMPADCGSCQRPLRAATPQGERVALANSETAPVGTSCRFSVVLLEDSNYSVFKEWMDYGKLKGIGQWRNSGKGRFTCEILEEQTLSFAEAIEFC